MTVTCYNLKMIDFIDYLLGEKTPLPDNWEDIHAEYIGLIESKSSLFILGVMKEISTCKAKYQIIQEACSVMLVCFRAKLGNDTIKRLKDVLKGYGFRAEYNTENPATFSRDIKAALSGSKRLIMQWERKEKELEEYQKRHAGEALQRKDFFVWAVTLSEFLGFRVDLSTIVVAEWCQMRNQYEKYCEVKNAEQNNKLKGHGRTNNR